MKKIKVLSVDDSAIVREVLSRKLTQAEDIEFLGTAPDPYIGRDKIVRLKPDVITLDIEMPRMDGLTFLEKLMKYYPLPVIIVSSITQSNSLAAIKAMELGAFDVVNKPGGSISVEDVIEDIYQKIRAAYENRDVFLKKWQELSLTYDNRKNFHKKHYYLSEVQTTDKLIAIGASTGGTVALESVFRQLPKGLPPIVVVQHMPIYFTKQFARRLNQLSELTITEADDGEILEANHVYVAPGGQHLVLKRKGEYLYTKLIGGEKVNFQKPAVDVTFDSVAAVSGRNTLAILLTGMGKDGAAGLLKIKENGGYTVAQDEKSSIVWGMPKAAVDLGAATEILSLDDVPDKIVSFAKDNLSN